MLATLLDPAILFFLLGLGAGALRSNLEVPQPVVKWLALYLMMAVGLKGGFTLAQTPLSPQALWSLGAALLMACATPLVAFLLFRSVVDRVQAGALAATYGSVSVVTFVTAAQHLSSQGVAYSGTMSVALVIMEIPAVLIGIALARSGARSGGDAGPSLGVIARDSLRDGAPLLLVGSLLIGWMTGAHGEAVMQPFSGALFKGMLALFLLQMGLDVARRFADVRGTSVKLIALAVLIPLLAASGALALGQALDLTAGDLTLLAVLSASASYIVAPAVLREAVPQANPALYLGMALGITFPFNLIVGIGLYSAIAERIAG